MRINIAYHLFHWEHRESMFKLQFLYGGVDHSKRTNSNINCLWSIFSPFICSCVNELCLPTNGGHVPPIKAPQKQHARPDAQLVKRPNEVYVVPCLILHI